MAVSFLDDLNQDQQRAVRWFNGPALVLAGAGSGKTRCLTYRVAYLIKEKKVDPAKIVLLTFTNKAASQMKSRVFNLVGRSSSLGFVGTFHSFGAFLLRRFAPFDGRDKNFVIYDGQDNKALIRDLIKKLALETQIKLNEGRFYIDKIKRSHLGQPDSSDDFGPKKEIVSLLFKQYQQELKKNNAFDFNDLLLETYFLLKQNSQVRRQLEAEYRFFLVDEYQDTNNLQYQLLNILNKKRANLFVVGDFSQSIYSFRGADYRNINRFLKDYPHCQTFKLPINYRSYPQILTAASQVISNNTTHPTLKLKPSRHGQGKITLLGATDSSHEALLVIRKVIELYSDGLNLDKMAILYRTHNQARLFEEVLLKAKLPYHIVGGWRFFERKEIKDILAYMRLLLNPNDLLAYKRAIKLGKRRFQVFADWRSTLNISKFETVELLEKVIQVTKYRSKYSPLVPEDKEKLENIDELLNFAGEQPKLNDFFAKASLLGAGDEVIRTGRYQKQEGKLNLMTIHAAKGLEFDVVFITGLEEGIFPHSLTQSLDQLEEERRLFYVALTRAKNKLYLSYAARRQYRGYYRNQMLSRFVAEVPENLIEIEDLNL